MGRRRGGRGRLPASQSCLVPLDVPYTCLCTPSFIHSFSKHSPGHLPGPRLRGRSAGDKTNRAPDHAAFPIQRDRESANERERRAPCGQDEANPTDMTGKHSQGTSSVNREQSSWGGHQGRGGPSGKWVWDVPHLGLGRGGCVLHGTKFYLDNKERTGGRKTPGDVLGRDRGCTGSESGKLAPRTRRGVV